MAKTERTDILIVGGGSAGFGACVAALEAAGGSAEVTLAERLPGLGGTSTYGGVNCWEPGIGGMGHHYELARRLLRSGEGCVGKSGQGVTARNRVAHSLPVDEDYRATLRRAATRGEDFRRFHFEPEAMSREMLAMLRERRGVRLIFGAAAVSAEADGRSLRSVAVETAGGDAEEIRAKIVIDCTASIAVARMAGCAHRSGEEPASLHGEPSAPERAGNAVNGATQLFRAAPSGRPQEIPPEYADVDVEEWLQGAMASGNPVCVANRYPCGDWNVNMLPTMDGAAAMRLGNEAKRICAARAYRYWRWITTETDTGAGMAISHVFPLLGIREDYRLAGRKVLTENDVRIAPLDFREGSRNISYGDHALDTHGGTGIKGPRCPELERPYAVPFECLLPAELDNLLVAGRGASFSHIAASSARLSRHMMALGEAAGTAAALALRDGVPPAEANLGELRERLRIPAFEAEIRENWGLGAGSFMR
jgi:hypothetical protein